MWTITSWPSSLRTVASGSTSSSGWGATLPYTPFAELPALVAIADLACVLQDPDHPVVRYQMPAKITDALAMGVPCLVRPVAPLLPLIDEGILEVYDDSVPLDERIV